MSREDQPQAAEKVIRGLIRTPDELDPDFGRLQKDAGFFDLPLELARKSYCDPKTLTRAFSDFFDKNPEFALGAGLAALNWLIQGYGYDITSSDILLAFDHTIAAAQKLGRTHEIIDTIGGAISGCVKTNQAAQVLRTRLCQR